jgi:hypothetical protein
MAELTLEQQQAIALANARARAAQAQNQEQPRYEYTGDIPTPMGSNKPTPSNWYDFGYAHTAPASYGEILSNAWDASKLAGLAPEIYPVGGVTQMPVGKSLSNIGAKASQVVNMPISAVKSIVGELAPTSMKGGYEVAKAKNPLYTREFNLGKVEGLSADDLAKARSGIANYFKAFFPNANKADVAKATSMSKEAGGVWDVAKKAAEAEQKMAQVGGRYNMTFPQDATLVLPQNVQSAQQAGMTAAKARQIGKEASWFPNMITLQDVVRKPFKLAGLTSPRINANLGYLAGKGENAYQMIPRLSDEDLLNLGLLSTRMQDRGQ